VFFILQIKSWVRRTVVCGTIGGVWQLQIALADGGNSKIEIRKSKEMGGYGRGMALRGMRLRWGRERGLIGPIGPMDVIPHGPMIGSSHPASGG
jgi:hypothetical protein